MTSANYKAPESSERTADRAPAGLGRFGVWATSWTAKPELAVAAERLGYGAIWLGSADGELRPVEELLDATSTITVATGIVNIWANPAGTVAEAWHRVEKAHPGRLLLGVGVGHREVIDAYYTDTDLTAPGSDRLVDDLIPHGTAGEVAAKLRAHLKAGADHVAIQLLTGEDADPLPGLTSLAEQLFG